MIIDSVEKWNSVFSDGEIASEKYVLTNNLTFNEQPQIPRLTGTFCGQNYLLTINYQNHKGFFRLDGGLICNLKISLGKDASINNYQGGLTNTIQWDGDITKLPEEVIEKKSVVKGCKFIGELNGENVGGLVGPTFLTVYKDLRVCNCEFIGNLGGKTAGGLCGSWSGSFGVIRMSKCQFFGNISGLENGGLVGATSSFNGKVIIKECLFKGNISGFNETGGNAGILGPFSAKNADITVYKCSYKGNINGTNNSGIVGEFIGKDGGNIVVKSCNGSGNIFTDETGILGTCSGIVGSYAGGQGANVLIDDCSFVGEISGFQNAGVLGGFAALEGGNVSISNCYAEGKVLSKNDNEFNSAGIIGFNFISGTINNCVYKGNVSGNFTAGVVGSLAGQNGNVKICNCSMEGTVFSDNPDQINFGNASGVVGSAPAINGDMIVEGCFFKGKIGGINTSGVVGTNAAYLNGNIKVIGCNCEAEIDGTNIGGICGLSPSINGTTLVVNCNFTGKIKGENNGGIIGNQSLLQAPDNQFGLISISGCKSNCCIVGKRCGGIIGANSSAIISGCEVSGCISGDESGCICGPEANKVVNKNSQTCEISECIVGSKVCGKMVGGIFGSNAENPSAKSVCLTGNYKNNNGAVIQSGKATLTGIVKATKASQAAGNGEVVNADIFFKNTLKC